MLDSTAAMIGDIALQLTPELIPSLTMNLLPSQYPLALVRYKVGVYLS